MRNCNSYKIIHLSFSLRQCPDCNPNQERHKHECHYATKGVEIGLGLFLCFPQTQFLHVLVQKLLVLRVNGGFQTAMNIKWLCHSMKKPFLARFASCVMCDCHCYKTIHCFHSVNRISLMSGNMAQIVSGSYSKASLRKFSLIESLP